MAKLNKIVRDNPISNFKQVAPDGGSAFRLLAEAMSEAYDRVAPAAAEKMEAEGAEFGRQQARAQFGESRYNVSTRNDPTGGDDFDFSPFTVEGGARPDAISGLEGGFREGLSAILSAAPDHIRSGLKIGSAYRSEQRQAELWQGALKKYGSAEKARKWVAPPGKSNHNHGRAADLKFANDETKEWVHQNAGQFGLAFPLSNEPWHIEDAGARGGETHRVSTRNDPGIVVRTKEGSLEARRFSPYAGPILQAHDAAAKVAYQSEVMNKGTADLLDMSNQYLLDPDGFAEAAEGYVDSMVEQAPEEMRADIRDVLGTEAHRRKLGIMGDKQADIRARANNSSKALMDRWQTNYAEALASGDPYEVAAAQKRLDAVLQAREALPGVAWTEEQSANVFIGAERMFQRTLAEQEKVRSAEYKDAFNLITAAAKEGRVAEGEEILNNPEAVAMHPELAREAAAFRQIRDSMPDFMAMTPAAQAATVAQLNEAEVSEEWELDVVDAARSAAKENRKAWADDPVKRAGEVLADSEMGPPPALPDLTPEDPQKFVAALADRKGYMDRIRAENYTDTMAYLTEQEAQGIAAFMGKDTPAELRAAMAGAIVAGFGPDAVTVFDEIGGDTATMFAGKIMAAGGRPDVAQAILTGQQMLAENLVQLPPKADRLAAFDGQIADAFTGITGAVGAQAEIMEAAKAIYATKAQGIEANSEAASELMAQSIQIALGQTTNKRGEKAGGVQPIMGRNTLLPVGISGEKADRALRTALTGNPNDGSFSGAMSNLATGLFGGSAEVDMDAIWRAAGATSVPMVNGKPIPQAYIDNDQVRIISAGGNLYRMQIEGASSQIHVTDDHGIILFFDLPKLMEATE